MGSIDGSNGVAKKYSADSGNPGGFSGLWIGQRKTLGLFLLSLTLLSYYITSPIPSNSSNPLLTEPANLHIVIPASKEDPNLCKVLLSAAVLGYPSPVIINWHEDFNDPSLVDGGSHLAKISGVQNYLASLDRSHDEDLMLLVDGFDIWFQLRPQTLIDRFFEINRRADQRIRAALGAAATKYGIRQEILFGCQKRCWPWKFHDPPCYAVPHSTLPNDVYGPRTDTDIGNEENPYIKYRQRFLNSGVGIGSVRAMRKLFDQALKLAEKERNFGSDQYIFSHIFGDQEIWREIVKTDSRTLLQRIQHKFNGAGVSEYPKQHLAEVRAKAAARNDENFEFGIGVDYESKIGLNTVFAEDDTSWLSFKNRSSIEDAQKSLGIDPITGHLQELEPDISETLPPFWTFTNEQHLPRWTSWRDVSLLTNVWTGVTPAIIHHNAHIKGLKSRRNTWWPNVWFLEHARTLLDAHIYGPVVPIALSGYDKDTAREWWPYDIWKGGARNGNATMGSSGEENWIRFDQICRPYHEEIFRDQKGAWELPLAH